MTNPTSLLTLLLVLTQFKLNSALHISTTGALEWSSGISSAYNELGDEEEYREEGRRSLFWRAARYYISYGALSANRVPCPPRSGRSYYTHNCYGARGPIRPYVRGCSAISRCRR
ncbi:unnamed protein product [Rhodiola kirilowii]